MIETAEFLVKDLHTYHKNPRIGDVKSIADSLRVNGQYRAIVVNKGTYTGRPMEVLAGNHTLKAARELGWESITAHLIDVDDDTAVRIVLSDNRTAENGSYEDSILLELLESLDDIDGTGFDDKSFSDLLQVIEPDALALTGEDEIPDVPDEPMTKLGDIIFLGDSILYIGDSTDTNAVLTAFNGKKADCIWTDPPYGVNYVGKTKDSLTIENDSKSDLGSLLAGAYQTAVAASKAGAPVYVAHADSERVTFETSAKQAGILIRQNLIWCKNSMVLGRSDYHYQHEPILYGFTPNGKGRLGRGGSQWYGDNSQTTVFYYDKPSRNAEHPTMKPVGLIQAMLKNSCPVKGYVLDLFGGSGSTLIACHGLGMNALIVELDPHYGDVICRRFEEHTGIVPIVNDKPASFIQN